MASSLPHDAGRRKLPKPAGDRLYTVSTTDNSINSSYGSHDNLDGRKRATTVGSLVVTGSLLDRRFSQRQARPSLPHLDIPNRKYDPRTQPVSHSTSVLDDLRSAPIAIPNRKSRSSRPTTPLTGREPSVKFLHSPTPSETSSKHSHRNSKDFTPSPDSQTLSEQSEQPPFAPSPIGRRTMRTDRGGHSPMYTPSSPLSPKMPVYSSSPVVQATARTPSHNQRSRGQPAPLAIPNLPPFHPANYESHSPSPRATARTLSASSHGRQLPGVQKRIQRQQRDFVINATQIAIRNAANSPGARPNSPRLNPLGSPGGPVTPLMLEGQGDYFLAGPDAGSTSALLKSSERRDLAERLIAAERDRIAHPERVERHSPAVSPAGGR
ncbi:MAG: hypothetical protein Q9170_000873 [Blastenia crenularia]